MGEPDFDTPDNVKAAGIAAIERGETKYTAVNGTAPLRRAIIDRLRRLTGLTYTDAEISVGSGAKHVIFTALMATLSPGDEVVIPAPYWVSYPDMVVLNDGVPVVVPCPIEDDFKLTPDRLRAALRERTRWLILNAPSNPTGAVYSADELLALAAVLRAFPQVLVLTDEIYDEVFLGQGRCAGLLEVAPDLRASCRAHLLGAQPHVAAPEPHQIGKAGVCADLNAAFGAGPRGGARSATRSIVDCIAAPS